MRVPCAGYTPRFFARPRIAVIAPTAQVCQRFEQALTAINQATGRLGEGRGPVLTLVPADELGDDGQEEAIEEYAIKMLRDAVVDVIVFAPALASCVPPEEESALSVPTQLTEQSKHGNGECVRVQRVVVSKPAIPALKEVLEGAWWLDPTVHWILD